ncbi:MAG TPA: SRPBCC family protein [Polyangiaceae bacterium]|jgi:uncharacterized protein YndB with AHSA1/START domain|nr:SRPBCC family protein [Polyangiaceae bacterium]
MTITHDTFTIERTLDASPERVFEALSKPDVKARWFAGPPGWTQHERRMDFRVGGKELVSGTHSGGITSVFDATYFDIVPNERIVYVYEMTVNGRKISTSLATFRIERAGSKTKLVLTEQGAYFDDPEMAKYAPQGQNAGRREGTEDLMNRFVAAIDR